MKKKINLIVSEIDKNLRVDTFISVKENEISRTRIKNLILDKKLKINDKVIVDPAKKISYGDTINLTIPDVHFEVSKSILEAGKHSYSEKPLSIKFEHGEELVNLGNSKLWHRTHALLVEIYLKPTIKEKVS